MMQPSELEVGRVYFGLAYEDDELTRPIVHSYEYLGTDINGAPKTTEGTRYCFRFLGSQDSFEVTQQQLDLILDLSGLVNALTEWRDGNPNRP